MLTRLGVVEQPIADGVVHDGDVDERSRRYFAKALDVIESDSRTQGDVDLFVYERELRRWLIDQGGVFGRLDIPPLSAFGKKRTPKSIQARLRELADPDGSMTGTNSIIAATDGSVGSRSASAAWVTSAGQWGWTDVPKADVCLAELYGVKALLEGISGDVRVTVFIDSREAVKLLNDRGAASRTKAIETVRLDIDRLREQRNSPVRFRWGKGHSGEGLNDGADRLAKLHRRGRLTDGELVLAEQIVEASVAAHELAYSNT